MIREGRQDDHRPAISSDRPPDQATDELLAPGDELLNQRDSLFREVERLRQKLLDESELPPRYDRRGSMNAGQVRTRAVHQPSHDDINHAHDGRTTVQMAAARAMIRKRNGNRNDPGFTNSFRWAAAGSQR